VLPKLPREKLLDLYKTMLVMRRFEEALIKLTKSGISVGHFHVYIGQECTGGPALSLLGPHDAVFTTHRNHGHLLARGADPGRLMAEILGKATGYNKGKGGTLHTTVRELGFLTTSGIVGGVIPLAAGAAFAAKQRKTDGASMCLFGDGALEEGVFHESLNMAALWSLPVIYLCENNSLGALGQKAGEFSSSTIAARSLLDLATPYGIPAVSVDEGQGFAVRTDLTCTPAAETTVTPDKAATASCEIKLSRAGKSRVRFEYRLADGMARTNPVTIEVGGAAAARALE